MPNPFPELDPYRPGNDNAAPSAMPAAETWLDQQMREDRDRQIKEGVLQAPAPDAVAKVSRLSQQTGQAPVEIEGNEDAIEKGQQAQAMASLAQQHPAIGRWAASNPRGVAAASDDTLSLGKMGTAFSDLTRSTLGLNAVHTMNRAQALAQADANPDLARLAAARQLRQAQARGVVGQVAGSLRAGTADAAGGLYGTAAAGAGLLGLPNAEKWLLDVEGSTERYSGNERGQSDNFWADSAYQGAESVPVAVGALLTGSERAGLALFASTQGGQSYAQARQQGLAPIDASLFGASQGALEAVFEALPLHELFNISKGAGVPHAIKRFLISEVGGEEATTVLQNLNQWATLNPDKSFKQFLAEQPAQMAQTLIATVAAAGPQIALAHAPRRIQQLAERGASADQAQVERQFFDQASKAANESKFKARDPESFRELVRHQAEDAGATHVFIPGEAVKQYQQSDSYDADSDPFDPQRYNTDEAAAAGSDIVMPIHDLLTDVVGTKAWDAIKDDVRLSPGGMSTKEAQSFQDSMGEVMASLSDEAAQRDKSEQAETTARQQLVDKLATMFGESFTAPVARQYAELAAQRAQTRASRLGMDLKGNEFDDLSVKQVMPESVAAATKADQLDLVINAMRQRKPVEEGVGPSLLQFIKKRGGINDSGGDLKAMGAGSIAREFDPAQSSLGGLSGAGDYGIDTTFRAAISEGYFPHIANLEQEHGPSQLDTNDFLDAIRSELAGEPLHAETRTDPMRAAGEDLRSMLENSGLHPDEMSDKEVRDAVERMGTEGTQGALYHEMGGIRGQFSFDGNKRLIELFDSRNLSTPLHELSHMWLEELRYDASLPEAPEQLKTDWERVKSYFAANGHAIGDDGQIPTEAHELWARSGERYFMEGKAPSSSLVRLFETFRSWLVNIYKTVDRLKAPISPEIREVFDRMLATDEEINATEERQGLQALFKDAASAGMSADEFTAYQRQVDDARADAHSKLLDKTMKAVRNRATERYREARKGVRQEEQDRIAASPVFRAIATMKEQRVNKAWIADNMGADTLDLLPVRVPPIYVEGGVHPDVVAEQSGYSSGRDMIEALIGAERAHRQAKEGGDERSMRVRAIETATDEEMNRRYGDPLNDGSIEREALATVHSDMQGEVIASELRVLSRKTGGRPTPYALAKEWARGKVRSGIVAEEASPSAIQRYARNAAKAGREAEAAMLKQDADETFRQKQFQMLNNALLSEAKQAADEVEAAVKRMGKIAEAKTRKSVDQDYLEQAQSLLEAVDLRKRSQVGITRQGKWEAWAAAREAEGYDVVVPASFEATLGTTNWSRLSVENLLALDEAVKQVMHLGRLKQTLLDNQEAREWDDIFREAEDGAGKIVGPPEKGFDDPGFWESAKNGVLSIDAMMLKMETIMDWLDGGNSNGAFNRIAFRPIADAQHAETAMLKDYYGQTKALFEAVPPETISRWRNRETLPFTDQRGRPVTMPRQKVIAMALNIGNEGNLQRLSDGYGWDAGAIQNYLNETLTAPEWQFVQGVWDTIETLWPQIEAMERRVNGVAPEKVEARSFVTPHGPMRGGYYPAIYDSTRDYKTEERRGKETDLFEGTYTRASTRSSATKERAAKATRPILFDLGVINRHLGEVIHDITHREAVMQANRFLTNERVMRATDQALGIPIRKQFRPWVKHVANSWAAERAGNEAFGKFVTKARANVTAVGLGFRATTILVHTSGLAYGSEVIGGKWMAHGIAALAKNPAQAVNHVMDNSPAVREYLEHFDRDIGAQLARLDSSRPLNKAKQHLQDAQRFMFHGIGWVVQKVTVPIWIGGYNKALSEGLSDADAKYAADKAVRQTMGSSGAKDLAAIQRGTGNWGQVAKFFTMFYTQMAAQYQRQRTLARDVLGRDERRPRDASRLAARAFFLIGMAPMWDLIIKMALSGAGPSDDEGWFEFLFQHWLGNELAPIPAARDLFNPIWNTIAGRHTYAASVTPLQKAYDSLVATGGDIGRIARGDTTKHATRNAMESTGYLTGMVPGQLASATQFLVDVSEGDADPQSVHDWVVGLSTGRVPKH